MTHQARALQHRKFDESLSSSNGSWTGDVSDAEGNENEIAFSNKDGDKGHSTHSPVRPTALFNNSRNPVSHPMERDEVSILNGIWPGSHNITLLIHFAACHFTGNWNSYLPFPHWADSQALESPSSYIRLVTWRSLKSNGGDLSPFPSSGNSERALGSRPAVGPKEMHNKLLGHNLCNKTDVDSIEFPPLVGLGTVATAASRPTFPRKVSLVKSSSGQPNIRTMTPTIRARTPAKVAAA